MAGETKTAHHGRGQGQGHGNHDHDRRRDRPPSQQTRQKPTSKPKKNPEPRKETKPQDSDNHSLPAEENHVQDPDQEPEMNVTQDVSQQNGDEGVVKENGEVEMEEKKEKEDEVDEESSPVKEARSVSPMYTPRPPRTLTQDNYDVRSFNTSLDEFVDVLSDPRYQEMHSDYPVDDLMSVVSMVSACIEEYKDHTQHTQNQLHVLTSAMKTVKENLHLSITRQAFDLTAEEHKTIEELELEAKLTQLNAHVAEAHATVAEANKLNAETNHTALQAHLAAQRARHEAERIQEEIDLKAEREKKKREEQERQQREEEKQQREEARKEEEERRAKEAARKRQEEEHGGWKTQTEMAMIEDWSPHIYSVDDGSEHGDLRCVIRAHPAHFNQNEVKVEVIAQDEHNVTYGDQEELISKILILKSTQDNRQAPVEPIFVAIPYSARLPASREPVVKACDDGRWTDLVTHEVTLDGYKEFKFAQAKVERFTQLLVMSRFKRDYLSVQNVRRVTKFTSSYDHRVVITVPKKTFVEKEHLVLQVQPVDSNTVNEFRSHDPNGKQLLTSSPILHMEWDNPKFENPINITLPCPPNPAKAKKLALLKKQKEEKLKAVNKPAFNVEELGKTKKAPPPPSKPATTSSSYQGSSLHAAADPSGEDETPHRQNKWYMGQYGQTEDDENDQLCLVVYTAGRWSVAPHIPITQAKLDLLAFDVDFGYERLMVLRTRTDVEEDTVKHIAQTLTDQLSQRSVKVLIKQRADDPYDVCCQVVPTAAVERTEKAMRAEGYTEGHDKFHATSVREGDIIIIQLRGNLKFNQDLGEAEVGEVCLPYNSNLPTLAAFHVCEVDRYLQRNYEMFRGVVRVVRRYEVSTVPKLRRVNDDECALPVYKSDVVCDVDIDIPKDHIDPDPSPKRVPVVLHKTGTVDNSMMRHLAEELGDEWQRLAHRLNVHRVRLQAILRTVNAGEGTEEQAKYEMLMTWFKRCPQAADKVTILSNALMYVGRRDLAVELRNKDRDSQPHNQASRRHSKTKSKAH